MSLHVHRRTLCLHHRRKTIRTLNVFKLTQNHFRASTMTATTCFTKTVLILWKKLERHTSGRAGQRRRSGCSPAARSTTCGRRRWTSTWQTSPSRHPQTEPEKFESTLKSLDGPVVGELGEGEELGEVDAKSFIYRLIKVIIDVQGIWLAQIYRHERCSHRYTWTELFNSFLLFLFKMSDHS